MTRCLRVAREDAEEARAMALRSGILDRGRRIVREDGCVLIPVLGDPGEGWEVVDFDAPPREDPETDYRKLAEVPEGLRGLLPSSYDIIGDVAVIKIPPELEGFRHEIGDALIGASPRLRLVLRDGGVKGERRVRDLEAIAGHGGSESTHVEFGVRMLIDPRKVYFNPRLAGERHRIASRVRDGETVLDMFAGAGPFPLVIWKEARPARIYAVDINPEALEYLEKNIRLNRADGIVPILGDVNEVMGGIPPVDRVIMNLPQSGASFLPLALTRCLPGAVLHLYLISERESWPEMRQGLLDAGRAQGRELEVLEEKELKTYSPSMSVYAIDLLAR